MGSSLTRLQIVQTALKQAGRGAELNDHTKLLLNALLRNQATENRYRCLRKIGSEQTIPAGACIAAFPSDMGGVVQAILFGTEKCELLETDLKDFIQAYGFQPANQAPTRPTAFFVDTQASVLRFNAYADQAYPFFPVHWRIPPDLEITDTDDQDKLWYENDLAIIQGLIWMIYQYTDDVREPSQFRLFQEMDARYRKGTSPAQSSAQRVHLSPGAFRPRARR